MRKLAFVPVFLPALSALKNPSLFYAIIAVLYIRRAHSRAKSLSVISITSLLYLSISVQPVLKCIRGNSILSNASRSGIDFLKSTRRFPVEYPLLLIFVQFNQRIRVVGERDIFDFFAAFISCFCLSCFLLGVSLSA